MSLNKDVLSNNEKLAAFAQRLTQPRAPEPVALTKLQVGDMEVDVSALEVALTALKKGKWTSIKPALKSVDSPLADLDCQDIADKKKKDMPDATTKEAFIAALEEVALSAGLNLSIVYEPTEVIRASKSKDDSDSPKMVKCPRCKGKGVVPEGEEEDPNDMPGDKKMYPMDKKKVKFTAVQEVLLDRVVAIGEQQGLSVDREILEQAILTAQDSDNPSESNSEETDNG